MNVKELAAKAGVSEQAVREFAKKNNFRKKGRNWEPTQQQINLLITYYAAKKLGVENKDEESLRKSLRENTAQGKASNESNNASNESSNEGKENLSELLFKELSILQEQLSAKDKQIENLQHTINELVETNKMLAGNAALNTAADKKDVLLSEATVIEEPREQKKKRGFWSSLFGD